ncbi:hypothetical protein ISX56_34605, partial [Serratia ureilytica]|nr:hypothetical protein [Serratia ureilytica]
MTSARVSGINVNKYLVTVYTIAGGLAALGGILLASRIGSSQVNAGGGYLMDAVAAAYIGFSLAGSGKPNALGTTISRALNRPTSVHSNSVTTMAPAVPNPCQT